MAPCTRHPDTQAGWRCEQCPADLCPKCAGWREAGHGRLEFCLKCGAIAHVLRDRRAVLQPFGPQSLAGAVRWPFSKEGLASAFACAFVLWLLSKGGALGTIVADGLVIAFMFQVTGSTARGHDDVRGAEDFRGFFEDVLGPLFRALVASIWAWGPFVAWVMAKEGGFFINGDAITLRAVTGPIPVLLLLAGTLLFPMALLAGALGVPVYHLLNPLVIVGYAVKLGRDYWLVSVFCIGVSLMESLLLRATGFIDQHVLGLPNVLQYTILLYPPLMMFRVLGMLVRARGDELGYGGESAYLVPVLGAVQPESGLVARDQDELLAAQHRDPEPARAPEVREIELTPEPDLLPAPLALARCVTNGDRQGAIDVLGRRGGDVPPTTLSAQAWIELGKACAAQGQSQLAIRALQLAVEVAPQGPLAPQALLQAARICDEKLGNRARSNQLLHELAERHPESPEGRFASRRLGRGYSSPAE